MNYKETLDLLYNMMPDFQKVGAGAYKPGLERTEQFCAHLGNPQKLFYTIHIAGTNGKGSVSHMIASILTTAGYRVGLYTSPHLRDFRERMRVDGEMISEHEVVAFAESHLDKMRELKLSFFEATVGMAFEWFAVRNVEVAVVETGLGGRLDATNILSPVVSVITNIGMDHMSFLGDTIEKIAAEKAGIIKRGVPVVIGQRDERSVPVFEQVSNDCNADIYFAEDRFKVLSVKEKATDSLNNECLPSRIYSVERLYDNTQCNVELDLLGDYQRHNIITALAVAELLNRRSPLNISTRAIKCGLARTAVSTGLRGRWQVLGYGPLIVADTGHNSHGLEQVMRQVREQSYQKLYMIFGVVDDKDLDLILPLLPVEANYIFTRASVDRALSAEKLSSQAARYGLEGEIATSVDDALRRALSMATPHDMIFVGGSTFVVADLDLDAISK